MHGDHVRTNGVRLYVVDSGSTGDVVVLLHDHSLWRHQVPALNSAGFRTVAIDVRGFGQSDKPKGVASYDLPNLVKDVEGVLDALNVAAAHIVGHDWGALLAWAIAGMLPQRTKQLVTISMGHPGCFFSGPAGFAQRKKSWYFLLYQFEGIAERAFLTGGAILEPIVPTEGAKQDYADMFQRLMEPETDSQAAAVAGGLNGYRANIKPQAFTTNSLIDLPHVSCSTLMIWPTGDEPFLSEDCPRQSGNFVDAPGTFRYERLECPTHFPMWDTPGAVTDLILSFIAEDSAAS